MTVSPMSRLEAVNLMLASIGEPPVSSLGVSDAPDVILAQEILDEVNRAVQTRGWYFNTEEDVELTPDVDGVVTLPANVSSADVRWINSPNTGSLGRADIVVREGKLYDRVNHTFDMGSSVVKVDVVYLFDFEDLPQPVRQYIAARGAREYQDKTLGDRELSRGLFLAENQALAELMREENRAADANVLNRSWSVSRAIRRRSPFNGLRGGY